MYDKAGRMVRGLVAEDFVLEEDGSRQTPDMVAQETIPTTFALLVDSSQSMWRNMEFVRAAAGRLTAHLRPKDRVLVAPFSKELRAVTGPTQDRQTINEAVNAINAQGGTAMRDSMVQIAGRFDGVEGRRVVVLITDAYDEHSQSSLADAVNGGEGVRRHGVHHRDRRRGRDLAEGARRTEEPLRQGPAAARSSPRGRPTCRTCTTCSPTMPNCGTW